MYYILSFLLGLVVGVVMAFLSVLVLILLDSKSKNND